MLGHWQIKIVLDDKCPPSDKASSQRILQYGVGEQGARLAVDYVAYLSLSVSRVCSVCALCVRCLYIQYGYDPIRFDLNIVFLSHESRDSYARTRTQAIQLNGVDSTDIVAGTRATAPFACSPIPYPSAHLTPSRFYPFHLRSVQYPGEK